MCPTSASTRTSSCGVGAFAIAVGTAAWFAAAWVAAGLSDSSQVLGFINAPDLQDFLLILYLGCLEVAFFEMMPWGYTAGQSLYKYSRWRWATAFAGISLVAWMTLFNPNGALTEVFKRTDVIAVLGIIAVLDIVLLVMWRLGPPAGEETGAAAEQD